MPALKGGAALPVTTGGSGKTEGGAAQPVYVVSGGPVVGGRARRVVVVTSGPVEGGAAQPVYDAGSSALYTDEPALPVYVVSGSLSGGSTPQVTPDQITDLALWLKADAITGLTDGAAVATWADSSGNGRDATQGTGANQPLYKTGQINSLPVVRFDGSNDRLQVADVAALRLTSGHTIFVVVKSSDTIGSMVSKYSTSTFAGWLLAVGNSTDASKNKLIHWFSSNASTFTNLYSTTQVFDGTARLLESWHGATPMVIYQQGIAEAALAVSPLSSQTGVLLIGAANELGAVDFLNGDIAEVVIYSRTLTQTERQQIQLYLNAKYNLGISSSNFKRFLVFDGDSLTFGGGVSSPNDYPQQCVTALGSGYIHTNHGVAGAQVNAMTADAVAEIDPLYDPYAPRNVCIIWGGTNDIHPSSGNVSAATAYSRIETYCLARRAAGWKVIVLTILPRENNATHESRRQTLNTSLRAGYTSFADRLADVAANANIGDAGDEDNTTYYNADKIHMTATGYGVVAGIVQTEIAALG